jgi:hypothetical protein
METQVINPELRGATYCLSAVEKQDFFLLVKFFFTGLAIMSKL